MTGVSVPAGSEPPSPAVRLAGAAAAAGSTGTGGAASPAECLRLQGFSHCIYLQQCQKQSPSVLKTPKSPKSP